MANIHCDPNGSCPYQYYCDSNNECIHNSVFPLSLYPIFIYCLFPLASAICNSSGNSFGEFKVLFLMDLLDYTESAATVVTYPLTVGTALFNFITLLPRRHPNKDTSVVDFNIVMIMIPSVLFGSTIGALTNQFIPPIIADALIIVILAAFSVKFFLRFYHFRKQEELERKQELSILSKELQIREMEGKGQRKQLTQGLVDKKYEEIKKQDEIKIIKSNEQQKRQNPYENELQKQLEYQSTYHLPHVLATCIIFVVFQTLSFLAQGKIIPFTICEIYYPIGISCLTVVFLSFIVLMYRFTKKKMEYYRKIEYQYEYKLDSIKFFVLIVIACFLGGFNGGVFGVGSSTAIIFCLLYLQIEPIIVTATVGYQVVFSGLGSLAEAFATNEITLEVAGFFFAITFVLGGVLSFIAMRFLKRLNQNKTNQVLMLIVGFLTGGSTIALIVNIALSYEHFGAKYMISSPFMC